MTRRGTTRNWQKAAGALAALALVVTACGGDDDDADAVTAPPKTPAEDTGGEDTGGEDTVDAAQGGSVLAAVTDRGVLNCGGNNGLAGFGTVDAATAKLPGSTSTSARSSRPPCSATPRRSTSRPRGRRAVPDAAVR